MVQVRSKTALLSTFLRLLLETDPSLTIVTPEAVDASGAQLSIRVEDAKGVQRRCREAGLVFDARNPNVVRLAPTALYNTFVEVFHAAEILKKCIL